MIEVAEPLVGKAEEENILEVLHSGRYVQGKYVKEFENKWADICNTEHAIGVTNGTAALHLALEVVGIGNGDRVAIPALSFGATAEAVYHAGAEPIFVDVEEATHTMDPTDLQTVAKEYDISAVIPVHLYGHPAAMDRITVLSRDYGFHIIEDAAQAHGARFKDQPVGGLSDIGCFSFYATKNITSGEGGMITTNSHALAKSLRKLRSHGMANRDEHEVVGWNYRLSEIHGAIGATQSEKLADFNRQRRSHSLFLREALSEIDWLEPLTSRSHTTHAWFWAPFATRTAEEYLDGKEIYQQLKEHGIECRHRYTKPLQNQKAFQVSNPRPLPTANKVAGNVIGLPNHPGLSNADLETIVDRLTTVDISR